MQNLSGTVWKLIEASAFDDQGHELPPLLGQQPMGLVMLEAERVIVAVSDGRLSLLFESPTRMVVTPMNTLPGRAAGLMFVWENN